MQPRLRWLLPIVTLSLVPGSLAPQSFEGIIRQRTVAVEEDGLMDVLYPEDLEEPDFDSQEEWLRWTASRLFAIPLDQFLSDGYAEVTETTTWVKGSRFRANESGFSEQGYTILDGESGEMFMVNPEERWYVRTSREEIDAATGAALRQAEEMAAQMGVDLEEMQRMAEEMGLGEEGEEEFPSTVRDLGESVTIAGIRAFGREVVSEEEITHAWCAEENPAFVATLMKMVEQLGFDEEDREMVGGAELACGEQLPLRVQTYSLGSFMGEGYSVEEFLSVEQAPVDGDLFEIPEGYTEKSLQDLWGVGGA
jgi:hypothetical protein